jgi:diguanylate cyclase (GGDEF)-like protein
VTYVATHVIDIAALLCLTVLLYSSTALNSNRKRPFFAGIALTIIIILSEAGTLFAGQGSTNLRALNVICNVLGFALAPIVPLAITFIFDSGILRRTKIFFLPTLINMVAAALSPFYMSIFYVDGSNRYVRGDHFFVFIIVYITNLVLLVISTLETGRRYNYPLGFKMVGLSFFTVLGTSLQLIYPSAYASWHCVTLALFLYFLLMSEFDSSFDSLTGLYNRAAFDNAAKEMEESDPFSVIVLDIDDFKQVNDANGHAHGDKVIGTVAQVVRNVFGKDYTCYRFGGDEFAIIGTETNAARIEERLRAMVSQLAEIREHGSPLPTVSYGYSVREGREESGFQQALQEADDQMYRYKKAYKEGGDRNVRRTP